MATQLQLRRGTTSETGSFTGAVGEVTVDTTKDTLVVHDGSTAGGHEVAKNDGSNMTAIDVGDNVQLKMGASDDLQIFHNGNTSFISEQGTGDLYIGASNNIVLMNAAFNQNKLLATTDGALKLYFNGSTKLATTTSGVDVTGTIIADDEIKVTAASGYGRMEVGGPSGAFVDLKSPDSDDYDLRIKTTGTGGEIDTASGEFVIKRGSAPKLSTTSSGVDVTGTATMDGLTVNSGNLNFMGGTNDAQYIKFGDTGDDDIGSILYYHGNNNMVFTTNTSEAMRIDASQNVSIPNGDLVTTGVIRANGGIDNLTGTLTLNGRNTGQILFQSGGNTKMTMGTDGSLTPIGGVYLGGTAAANKLDDYEEGTWTPAFTFGTSGSVTYTTQTGTYRKVGSLVFVSIAFTIASVSSPTGAVTINNLPFASGSDSNFGAMTIGQVRSLVTARPDLAIYSSPSSATLAFSTQASNAGFSEFQGSDLQAGTVFFISGCYISA